MTTNSKTLGRLIKFFRERKGYSQEELAEICNLSPSYISYIETGKRQLTIKLLLKIASILDFSFQIKSNLYCEKCNCNIESDIHRILSHRSIEEKLLAYNLITCIFKEFDNMFFDK